jgi:hypothetical protein
MVPHCPGCVGPDYGHEFFPDLPEEKHEYIGSYEELTWSDKDYCFITKDGRLVDKYDPESDDNHDWYEFYCVS